MGILADVGRSTAGQTGQTIFSDIMKYKQMENQDARDARTEAAQAQQMDIQKKQYAIQEAEAARKAAEYNDAHTVMSLNDDRVNAEKRGHGAAFKILEEVLAPAVYTDPNGKPVYLKKDRQAAQAQLMKDPHLKFKMNNALLEGLQAKYDDAQSRVDSYQKWKEANPDATLEESQAKSAKAQAALEEMTALKGDLNKQRTITYMSDPEFIKIKLSQEGKEHPLKEVNIGGKPVFIPQGQAVGMEPYHAPTGETKTVTMDKPSPDGRKHAGGTIWERGTDGNYNKYVGPAKEPPGIAMADEKNKGMDIPALAKSVYDGQDAPMAIKGSMGNPVATKVKTEILKVYPKFRMDLADANYKWTTSPINNRTINYLSGSLPRVAALNEQISALGNTTIPAINAVWRRVSKEFGNPEFTNFESNRNAIVQEVNTALSGSATGSDMRIKLELENLKAANSPAQISGAVRNLNEALLARYDASTSPQYPIEVVRGEKTMAQYQQEIRKKYVGNYLPSGSDSGKVVETRTLKDGTTWDKLSDGTFKQRGQ